MLDSESYCAVSAVYIKKSECFYNTFNGFGAGSTPSKSRLPDCPRKGGIFAQKAIAGDDGISLLLLRDFDDVVSIRIRGRIGAGQEHGFVGR